MRKQRTIIIILLLFLFSCSPQKRLERLLKKHQELLTIDTITFRDTIYTQSITIDTAFITSAVDTILIIKDNLSTQVIRHNDSIFVYSNYAGDTIYIEKQIPIKTIINDSENKYTYILIGSVLALLILLLIIIIINKRKQGNHSKVSEGSH